MEIKLDDLDLRIVRELQEDGRMSITDLAERVGSSRPTVTNRLKRLVEDGVVVMSGGLSLVRLGFKMGCVGLEVRDGGTWGEVERCLRGCPRVLNAFRTPGKANFHVSLWGEDPNTLKSIIESYRDYPKVEVVYCYFLGTPIHGDVAIEVEPAEHREPACGRICSKCVRYVNGWCLGCPCSTEYKNPLLE